MLPAGSACGGSASSGSGHGGCGVRGTLKAGNFCAVNVACEETREMSLSGCVFSLRTHSRRLLPLLSRARRSKSDFTSSRSGISSSTSSTPWGAPPSVKHRRAHDKRQLPNSGPADKLTTASHRPPDEKPSCFGLHSTKSHYLPKKEERRRIIDSSETGVCFVFD